MKYFKRLDMWKAANLTFNPRTLEARSYEWYHLLLEINGKIVLNPYRYSVTTAKHVHKLRTLLEQLGIKVHAEIEAPNGLSNLGSAFDLYSNRIVDMYAAINKPGTKTAKNAERLDQIKDWENRLELIEQLMGEEAFKRHIDAFIKRHNVMKPANAPMLTLVAS